MENHSTKTLFLRIIPPSGRVVRAGACVAVTLAAVLSLTPQLSVPDQAPAYTDLVLHLGMHAGTAGLVRLGWPDRVWQTALGLIALAVLLELGQAFSPGRTVSTGDLAMNLTGAALGCIVAWVLLRKRVTRA